MQFSYKIENYYPYESRVFVVYTPVDKTFEPLGGWVTVTPTMTDLDVKAAVVAAAPLDKWGTAHSAVALALVGTTNAGALTSPPPVVPTPPTLADVQAAKIVQINQWREAANLTYFTHAGKQISCSKLSRDDISGVAGEIGLNGVFPAGFPGGWKAMDNTYIPLPDIASFKLMYSSMTAQGTTNFNHSQTLKAAVAAATTVAQVNAIVWG